MKYLVGRHERFGTLCLWLSDHSMGPLFLLLPGSSKRFLQWHVWVNKSIFLNDSRAGILMTENKMELMTNIIVNFKEINCRLWRDFSIVQLLEQRVVQRTWRPFASRICRSFCPRLSSSELFNCRRLSPFWLVSSPSSPLPRPISEVSVCAPWLIWKRNNFPQIHCPL